MPKAIDLDFEVTAARAMLAELDEYLKSDVAYWETAPNALGEKMPKLTIGGLLEALLRAEAAGAVDAPSMRETLKSIRLRQLGRYLAHAEQEARSRLDAWQWYLDDYTRTPEDAAGFYAGEIRARLKAELLLNELEAESRGRAERLRAAGLDERVRASFAAGAFVWDERLQPRLPADRFWWLHGRLRA